MTVHMCEYITSDLSICHKKTQVSCSNSQTERSCFTNISQQLYKLWADRVRELESLECQRCIKWIVKTVLKCWNALFFTMVYRIFSVTCATFNVLFCSVCSFRQNRFLHPRLSRNWEHVYIVSDTHRLHQQLLSQHCDTPSPNLALRTLATRWHFILNVAHKRSKSSLSQ